MPQQAALPGHVLPGGKMLPMPTGEATSPVLVTLTADNISEPPCIACAARKHGSNAPSAPCRPGLS